MNFSFSSLYRTSLLILFTTSITLGQTWKENYDKGKEYYKKWDWGKSIEYYEKARTQLAHVKSDTSAASREETLNYAMVLSSLGYAYLDNERLLKPEALFKESINIQRALLGEKHPDYATSVDGLGALYLIAGRLKEAEPLLKKSKAIREETIGKNHIDYAASLKNMGSLYEKKGLNIESELSYINASKIYKKQLGKNSLMYGGILHSLGYLYTFMNRTSEAELLYKKNLKIMKDELGSKHLNYINTLLSLGVMYSITGRYVKAEKVYKELSETMKEVFAPNHLLYATLINNMAALYERTNRYDEAEKFYIEALEILVEPVGKSSINYLITFNSLARIYSKMGKYEKAEILYKKGIAISKEQQPELHQVYKVQLKNLSHLYMSMNRYAEAEAILLELKDLGNHSDWLFRGLADLYLASNRYEEAALSFQQAIASYIKDVDNNFHYLSEQEKRQFVKWYTYAFEEFNSFVLKIKEVYDSIPLVGKMYNNQLLTKALLLSSTTNMKRTVMNSGDTLLISLFNEWTKERKSLARAHSMSSEQREAQGINIPEIEKNVNELERQLSQKSAAFAQTTKVQRAEWKDIQAQLKPTEAAIEMIRFRWHNKVFTDTIYYAALIITPDTKDQPEMVVLKNGNDLDNDHLKAYQQSLKDFTKDENSYQHYWQPIQDKLIGINKVYFSADGVYNLINVNTLLNTQTNAYVFDEIEIQLVTSTKDILQFSSPDTPPISSLSAHLFGSPAYDLEDAFFGNLKEEHKETPITRGFEALDEGLPIGAFKTLTNTVTEVTNIAEMLDNHDWEMTSYLGAEALEEKVKALDNPTVLHIATHGYFKSTDKGNQEIENTMLSSGLILAGINNYYKAVEKPLIEDGILTAYECTTLNLDRTELVVLSACETGLGTLSSGEGVYGLQRGLKVAGAKSILMSLWQVNDLTTQELMTTFYEEWLSSGDKLQAFRTAQQKIKNKYPHPYYWGGFVMVGDNTIIETTNDRNWILYSFVVLFLMIFGVVIIKSRLLKSAKLK